MGIAVAVLLFLILLNGLFAMSELAMMTARRSRLQQEAAKGSGGAATALRLAAEPTRFLSTVQVGITMIGILSGALAENAISDRVQVQLAKVPLLAPYAGGISLFVVVLAITYCSLILGELVPKRIALAYPEITAAAIARPLSLLSVLAAWPVLVLTTSTELVVRLLRIHQPAGDDVSEEDVRALVARAASTGVFTKQEHTIFNRLMRVGGLTVRDLMVPRTDIVWIDISTTAEELRALVGTSPYSHFPVAKGELEEVVGVVHIKDLIAYGLLTATDFRVSDLARKPLFVPETAPALRLLDQFRQSRVHVAFVVDEHGNTEGLLTLNDIVSALIGDVARLGEPAAPEARRRDDGSWLVDGRLSLADLHHRLSIAQDESGELTGVSTAAGLVLALLGHVPHEGDRVEWQGWRLEVVDMDGVRIDKILMEPCPPPKG